MAGTLTPFVFVFVFKKSENWSLIGLLLSVSSPVSRNTSLDFLFRIAQEETVVAFYRGQGRGGVYATGDGAFPHNGGA